MLYICHMAKKSKRPTDINQRAKSIVDIATGESEDTILNSDGKNAAAVALGRLGGLKGGKARAERNYQQRNVLILLRKRLKQDGVKKEKSSFNLIRTQI